MKSIAKLALLAAMLAPVSVYATSPTSSGSTTVAADQMTEGEIRKVDKTTKKITIKHGELKNLDMPPMTMVFQVKDPAMLDQVKAGDQVRFVAEKVEGRFTVTHIEAKQ